MTVDTTVSQSIQQAELVFRLAASALAGMSSRSKILVHQSSRLSMHTAREREVFSKDPTTMAADLCTHLYHAPAWSYQGW